MNRPFTHRLAGVAPSPVAAPATHMECLECEGAGEAEYMALDAVRPHWDDCHVCHGTGLVAPYCETCEGKLTDGFCLSCDVPSGWALAERSAWGMSK